MDEAAAVDEPVVPIEALVVAPVDPVQDVEAPVGPEEEDLRRRHEERKKRTYVVRRQVFDFSVALEYEELWNDGDGLEENGEGPEEVDDGEEALEEAADAGEGRAGSDGELHVEKRVLRLVVLAPVGLLEADHVDDKRRRRDVRDLHEAIVHGIKRREEVQIPRDKYEQKQLLRLQRNARRVLVHAEP